MLTITIHGTESFNEATSEFVPTVLGTIELEHSLVSLARWESKWEKPFLDNGERTTEETMDYIRFMCLAKEVPEELFSKLTDSNNTEAIAEINKYIDAKMTATWFAEPAKKLGPVRKEVVTAEVVYYWMVSLNIPFECQYWHLNRLITLVRVINEKNAPPKKMSQQELVARNREINEQRLRASGGKG